MATDVTASGHGLGLLHGRLNMRKNGVPWRMMLQENRYLNRWRDLFFMVMAWLNEATCDLLYWRWQSFSSWRSHRTPSGSRHYFDNSVSLSKFLTFCYLISSCLLFTEWLEDKSSVWQRNQEIKAVLFVFIQRQSKKGTAKQFTACMQGYSVI